MLLPYLFFIKGSQSYRFLWYHQSGNCLKSPKGSVFWNMTIWITVLEESKKSLLWDLCPSIHVLQHVLTRILELACSLRTNALKFYHLSSIMRVSTVTEMYLRQYKRWCLLGARVMHLLNEYDIQPTKEHLSSWSVSFSLISFYRKSWTILCARHKISMAVISTNSSDLVHLDGPQKCK